jgi:hypothetical protein
MQPAYGRIAIPSDTEDLDQPASAARIAAALLAVTAVCMGAARYA